MGERTRPAFFLGAGGPGGFTGFFEQLQGREGWRLLLLKGGPGCGKSTLLGRIGAAIEGRGYQVEYIHCASDPASLDGVICPGLRLAALDATAPHALEPACPGALEEVVSLYEYACGDLLRPRQRELLALNARYAALQKQAGRYFAAAGLLLRDTARMAAPCFDTQAAARLGRALARRLPPCPQGKPGVETRLLSAVTPDGPVFFHDTVRAYRDIVVLEDDYAVAAPAVLNALRDEALAKGYTVYACPCPMAPHEKTEHLLIPRAGLAVVTTNRRHPLHFPGRRVTHCTRFANKEALAAHRERFRFNARAARAFLEEAAAIQAQARAVHGIQEGIYGAAMDFQALSARADALVAGLFDR